MTSNDCNGELDELALLCTHSRDLLRVEGLRRHLAELERKLAEANDRIAELSEEINEKNEQTPQAECLVCGSTVVGQ